MSAPPRTPVCIVLALLAAAAGCSRHDARLAQHQKTLESLGATTEAITEAWLGGHVSGTYTRTALEQTYQLVEKERAALAQLPIKAPEQR